jgi:predicted site-specific integrase-resolvase
MTPPVLLTTRQLAERWQLTPDTILRNRRAGRLPSVKLPTGAIRFRLEDVEAIESRGTPSSCMIMDDCSPRS